MRNHEDTIKLKEIWGLLSFGYPMNKSKQFVIHVSQFKVFFFFFLSWHAMSNFFFFFNYITKTVIYVSIFHLPLNEDPFDKMMKG
jgi:hypothetical protein